jgi:N-hydroxyarylamine O-acetyltransferase
VADQFDLDAYFKRIGFAGSPRADLATLTALQGLHVTTMPFENLNPLMGLPVDLDPASLQAKLVGQRRGGYCFEQNAVFRDALAAVGFSVTNLAARVRWMAPPDAPMGARAHMLLRVDLDDGPWLVDVGFGGHIIGAPIRMVTDEEQTAMGATLRLVDNGVLGLRLETLLPDGWQALYIFRLEPVFHADYVQANWSTATHPESIFVNGLMAERLTPEARYSLFNRKFTTRWADGRTEQRALTGADDLAQVLDQAFNLTPPAPAAAIWAKLPEG